ncbi:MAG TPA: DUF3551 domain-containing protein [Bradyrhizobium sp.]|nr:DUF3551 domain-containing protein [Bradyrhizobium sp.]
MTRTRSFPLVRTAAWTILAAMVTLAAPARAQTYDPNYPVCLQVYQSMVDYYFECAYTSIPQCQASASGRAAQCVVNPYYAGPKVGPGRHKKRTHAY